MDILHTIPIIRKWNTPFQSNIFFAINKKLPRLHFTLSIIIAITGFLFLLLFPYLFLTLPFELYDSLFQAKELKDGIKPAIQLIAIILSGTVSWKICTLKFSLPIGLDVTKEKFPLLVKLIEELQAEFAQPKIDRIIIRDDYDIQIIKTPISGKPFLNTRTLIIGLPVLQTMSPLYFKALLARKIGQLSTQHTPVTTHLYFLTTTWEQFKTSCKASKGNIAKGLGFFFTLYHPLYRTIMMPLLQAEELEADRYGMDLINHNDMVECLVYETVVKEFLEKKFWPKIYHMAKRSKVPEFTPYSQITKVIKAGITDDEISTTIQAALKVDINHTAPMPSLTKRLNHLGHAKPLPPKRLTKTAAEYLLAGNLGKIIHLFDKRWLKKMQAERKV